MTDDASVHSVLGRTRKETSDGKHAIRGCAAALERLEGGSESQSE
jgi:hypothetical protein